MLRCGGAELLVATLRVDAELRVAIKIRHFRTLWRWVHDGPCNVGS